MRILSLLAIILVTFGITNAQDSNKSSEEGFIREFSFLPMPVIAANPANGVMYGLAPSASWLMGDISTTHRSSMVSSVIYTTKSQLILTLKTNIFLKDDSWNLMGDWRYFVSSQPTFGLGTGPQSSKLVTDGLEYNDENLIDGIDEPQLMEFNYVRFHQTFLKNLEGTRYFIGLGYHLDYHYEINDQLLRIDTLPTTITSHYGYSRLYNFLPFEYSLSGISVNALYDSRNNPINPYSGRYGFISFRYNPEFLGSDQNSSTIWMEYRDYLNVNKNRERNLIAFWVYGNMVTSGNVPYMDLPAVGWDQFGRSGRAYPQGRFRGQSMAYAEAEYRLPLQKEKDTFGAVVFANATTATNEDANINLFDYVNPGAGLGLRIMINKQAKTNLTLDYGWGSYGASGFYLNVNETF